jgi:hypothetical protein
MSDLFKAVVLALSGLALAGPVSAATLNEGDVAGGDFSGSWASPTVIAAGPTTINGLWQAQNDYDILHLTGLKDGAQDITVTFAPIKPIGPTDWGFSAGGYIKWATAAFRHQNDGNFLANQFSLRHDNRTTVFSFVLRLADSFSGASGLYLNLKGTHMSKGVGLSYAISAPGNAVAMVPPAAVPLPAGMLLLGSALAGLAFLRRRRA